VEKGEGAFRPIVAGAAGAKIGSNLRQGAAYVFVKPSNGWATATETAKLTASNGAMNDNLGSSVATNSDGSTIVAGALGATIGSNTSQGAAYVFVEPSSGWVTTSSFTAKLTASDGAAGDFLGNSVGTSSDGSTIVAGAPKLLNFLSKGAAYVFVKPSSGWATATESAKLSASDGAASDLLGVSVGLSGDGSTIVAGADGSNSNQGAAYVFVSPLFAITPTPATETIGPDEAGAFLLTLKSVNGFKGNVTLSCSGGPAGSRCITLPMKVYLNGTAYAVSAILVPENSIPGTYVIAFTGTSGSLTAQATATLIVAPETLEDQQ
jgi:hypothetical protein